MNTRLPSTIEGKGALLGNHLELSGTFATVTQAIAARHRLISNWKYCEHPRLDWMPIAMTTGLSNQQNALMPNDLQYITALLSRVCGGIMNATAPLHNRSIEVPVVEPSRSFWTVCYRIPGNR